MFPGTLHLQFLLSASDHKVNIKKAACFQDWLSCDQCTHQMVIFNFWSIRAYMEKFKSLGNFRIIKGHKKSTVIIQQSILLVCQHLNLDNGECLLGLTKASSVQSISEVCT